MENEGLIEGEEGQYGLFITAVDGVKADDSKNQWWCITKNGEQVNTGVDTTQSQTANIMNLPSQPTKGHGTAVRTRELVQTALMGAILRYPRLRWLPFPHRSGIVTVDPLYAGNFSKAGTVSAYLFALLEGLVYGFGMWWIMYLYVWPALVLITWLLKKNRSVWLWAFVSAISDCHLAPFVRFPTLLAAVLAPGSPGGSAGFPTILPTVSATASLC